MDDYTIEIIVFVIILLIVAGKPYSIMEMAESILGKFILLVIVVALALKSTIAGLMGALLVILLSEGLREGMKSKEKDDKKNTDKKNKDKKEDEKKEDENSKLNSEHEKKDSKKKDDKDKTKEDKDGKKGDKKKEEMAVPDRLGIKETMEKLQKLASITNKL